MKNCFVVLLGIVLFIACKRRGEQKFVNSQINPIHVLHKAEIDSDFATNVIIKKQEEDVEKIDDKLKTISAVEYKDLDSLNKLRCDLDSSGFIKNLGVTLKSRCVEICETHLFEIKSGKTMLLISDFDTGLLGLLVSPLCDRFLTYSSYDMPDYDKYYTHRALIVLYDIDKGVGLKAIKQKKTFSFNAWSIREANGLMKSHLL